jgi:dihydroorotate dehydrogenase (NAD+) catalytic subunit
MDLSANIAGMNINPAIMNASGIFSFPSVLKRLSNLSLGAFITKSACYDGKEGFENPIFTKCSEEAWINAVGLPNAGAESKKEELKELYPHFRAIKKPLIVSLFDNSTENLKKSILLLNDFCDAFELNLSCPNLMPGENFGIVIGRDPKLVSQYVEAAKAVTAKPVIVKLSAGPYIDDRERIKKIVLSAVSAGASAISATNTISGGMKIDIHAKKPVLAAKYGAMSGKAIKPFGIGCVYTIYEALKENNYSIPIIGIGGVDSAEDIIEYIEAGASAVAIGTAFANRRIKDIDYYLSSIVSRLKKILDELEVDSLQDLRGAAHES